MEKKILPISLELNFILNTSGCYGLSWDTRGTEATFQLLTLPNGLRPFSSHIEKKGQFYSHGCNIKDTRKHRNQPNAF